MIKINKKFNCLLCNTEFVNKSNNQKNIVLVVVNLNLTERVKLIKKDI